MKIGLLIAMEEELQAFLDFGKEGGTEVTQDKVGHFRVYRARIGSHDILGLLTGYGEIDAAAATQLLITWGKCEVILNFGVTGALVPSLKVSDLFVVRKVCHYDFDVSPIDPVKKHQYMEFPDEFIPLDDGLIRLARETMPELVEAAVASGDHFVEDRKEKQDLAALGCQICDMEIAAIARVSALNGIRCLSVKCISDTVDGDGSDYAANVTRSASLAFRVLLNVIQAL